MCSNKLQADGTFSLLLEPNAVTANLTDRQYCRSSRAHGGFFGLEKPKKRDRAYCKRPAAPVLYSTAIDRQVGGWSGRDWGVADCRPWSWRLRVDLPI